jgi:hypothetical protein
MLRNLRPPISSLAVARIGIINRHSKPLVLRDLDALKPRPGSSA